MSSIRRAGPSGRIFQIVERNKRHEIQTGQSPSAGSAGQRRDQKIGGPYGGGIPFNNVPALKEEIKRVKDREAKGIQIYTYMKGGHRYRKILARLRER